MYSIDQWLLWSCYSLSCKFLFRHFLYVLFIQQATSSFRDAGVYICSSLASISCVEYWKINIAQPFQQVGKIPRKICKRERTAQMNETETHASILDQVFRISSSAPLHQPWKHTGPELGVYVGCSACNESSRGSERAAVPGHRGAGGLGTVGQAFSSGFCCVCPEHGGSLQEHHSVGGATVQNGIAFSGFKEEAVSWSCTGQAHQVSRT